MKNTLPPRRPMFSWRRPPNAGGVQEHAHEDEVVHGALLQPFEAQRLGRHPGAHRARQQRSQQLELELDEILVIGVAPPRSAAALAVGAAPAAAPTIAASAAAPPRPLPDLPREHGANLPRWKRCLSRSSEKWSSCVTMSSMIRSASRLHMKCRVSSAHRFPAAGAECPWMLPTGL